MTNSHKRLQHIIRHEEADLIYSIFDQVRREFGRPKPIISLIERYALRALPVELGRTRLVFMRSTFVIKVPITLGGIADNDWEGSISNGDDPDPGDVMLARTRLLHVDDYPIVLMERVEEASYAAIKRRIGHVPDWVASVDCGQVGFARDGRLVAFDYGRT